MERILQRNFHLLGNTGYLILFSEPFILDNKKLPPELEIVDAKKLQSKKRWELRF
jgi:hypothetical protein